LTAIEELLPIKTVYPSAGAESTACVAMKLFAPGLFSITTDWDVNSESFFAKYLAEVSVALPGGNGTINLIVFEG
jgi:hypothetical protein